MRKIVLASVVFLIMGAWFATGQPSPDKLGPSQGPTFALSPVEQLQLENLRLRRDLLMLQVQGYVSGTLSAHGNPQGVRFNPGTFNFEVVPQTIDKPAHPSIEKNLQKK